MEEGSVQQELGCDTCSHCPTLQQADVGLWENISPLGSWVEIRALEHSGNNRLQEVPCFDRASDIICLTQRETYLVTKQKQGCQSIDENVKKQTMKNYDGESVCLQQRKDSKFLIVYGRGFWVKSKHFWVVSKGARATAVPGAVRELPSKCPVLPILLHWA